MANPYYTHNGSPSLGSPLSSAVMRSEFDAVSGAFNLLPTFATNAGKVVRVASSEDSLVAVFNNWPIAAAFAPAAVGSVYEMNAADVTVLAATFAAGDVLRISNNDTVAHNIVQGAGLTLHLAGGALTGNRILAQWGFAFIFFRSASAATIFGFGVT